MGKVGGRWKIEKKWEGGRKERERDRVGFVRSGGVVHVISGLACRGGNGRRRRTDMSSGGGFTHAKMCQRNIPSFF